jgi:hypothetical protein
VSARFSRSETNPDHHVVAHQVPGIHRRSRDPSERGAVLHRLAQDVAGRDLRQTVSRRESLCLGALARPRRAEHDDVQRHRVTLFHFIAPAGHGCGSSS